MVALVCRLEKNMLDVTSKTPEAWEISRATPLELGISEVFKGDGLGANSQTELHVYNLINTNINNYKGRVISKLYGNLHVFLVQGNVGLGSFSGKDFLTSLTCVRSAVWLEFLDKKIRQLGLTTTATTAPYKCSRKSIATPSACPLQQSNHPARQRVPKHWREMISKVESGNITVTSGAKCMTSPWLS